MFVGVVLFSLAGLLVAASLENDIQAVIGCVVVLSIGVFILDKAGRKQAALKPHPLYAPGRLPSDSPKLKFLGLIMTLVFLVIALSLTTRPNEDPSPYPFFLAAAWVMLILPQALARRAIRRYDEEHKGESMAESDDEGSRKVRSNRSKKRKRKLKRH